MHKVYGLQSALLDVGLQAHSIYLMLPTVMQSNNLPSSGESTIYVGLDLHKNSISTCAHDHATGQVCMVTERPNYLAKMRKLVGRIRNKRGEPQCCCEASSRGYVLYSHST